MKLKSYACGEWVVGTGKNEVLLIFLHNFMVAPTIRPVVI